jgi:hypothetical protein
MFRGGDIHYFHHGAPATHFQFQDAPRHVTFILLYKSAKFVNMLNTYFGWCLLIFILVFIDVKVKFW